MKEYNRKTRKWEEPKLTENVSELKKRDHCKGGRQHDYVLVVPDYGGRHINDNLTFEDVAEYYRLMDEHYEYEQKLQARLIELGIRRGFGYRSNRKETRYYTCVQCGKKEYDLKIV